MSPERFREKVCIWETVSRVRISYSPQVLNAFGIIQKSLSSQLFRDESLSLLKKKAIENSSSNFYVYIHQILKDFSFYVGQCDDLDRRMSKHFDGMSKYTSGKRPLRLVYFEVFKSIL